MRHFARRPALSMLFVPAALALLVQAGAAAIPTIGAEADGEAADSQWTVPDAAPPSPGAPSGTPEGGYADPDRRRMDEARRKDVLDQLCRKFKLRKEFSLGSGDWPVATLGLNRRMESDIDGGLALIDEEMLRASWSHTFSRAPASGGATGAVWGGATVEGKSMVVRRLGTFDTCAEVDRLIDVTDIKLALPFNAGRIMQMGRGELWRIPLTLNVGYGVSFADAMNKVSMSFGVSKSRSGTASMTLWRLSEKQARFRFRIDQVAIQSRNLGVNVTIPAVQFAATGGSALMKLIDKGIANELAEYTMANLALSKAKSNGKRLVLEFVIDPTVPAEAEAMAEALKGNFSALLAMAKALAITRPSQDQMRDDYEAALDQNAMRLGNPSYAALSEYSGRSESLNINVPFVVRYSGTKGFGSDKIMRYTGEGGEFRFDNAARTPSAEYFNVPFVGPIVKDLEHHNIDVVTYTDSTQDAKPPFAVYIHNQAFLRLPASLLRRRIEETNETLRLAGVARGGVPGKTMEIPQPPVASFPEGVEEPSDQKGWISMTIVLNQKAVAGALSASMAELLKAFAVATPVADRTMAEWLAKNGRLEGDRLVYDQAQAASDLKFHGQDGSANWLAGMSQKAAGVVRDMAEAAAASTHGERAAKLAKAFSQDSRSGLSHQDLLRILIQFVDPMDVTGDFAAAVEYTSKRAVNINTHYVLKKGRAEVPNLGQAGDIRARFTDGSVLTD